MDHERLILHDIRSALMIIRGRAQLLVRYVQDDRLDGTQVEQMSRQIIEQTDRVMQCVTEMDEQPSNID